MACEISMSGEGWEDIYETLHEATTKKFLAEAIAAERIIDLIDNLPESEYNELQTSDLEGLEFNKLMTYSQEHLANTAFEIIQQNNTCDNDRKNIWIDKKGRFKVNAEQLYEYNFQQSIKLLDCDVTNNDPATVEAFYRRSIPKDDFFKQIKNNGCILLSDDETKIGIDKKLGVVVLMGTPSESALNAFNDSEFSKTEMNNAYNSILEHSSHKKEQTNDFSM